MTITTEAPLAEVSPEVADALARLDRIDPLLVSDELRALTLAQAQHGAEIREAQETVQATEAAILEATQRRDRAQLDALVPRLTVDRLILDDVSRPHYVSPEPAAASIALARAAVDRALASVPSAPPVLAYAMERAAFDSVPRRPGDKLQPPVCVDGDLETDVALQDLESERVSIARYVGWWHEQANDGRSDALDLMARVADFRATCAAHAERAAALTVTVTAANASRTARRLLWTWPHGSTTTPEVEALAAYRKTAGLAAQAVA
jgi:hypothetical protein